MNLTIVNKISDYLSNQPVEKAWIFGSYARSEETPKSDIDLLVRWTPNEKITLLKYIHLMNELQKLTQIKVDLVEEGLLKNFATESVNAEKVLIYERTIKR